MNLLAKTHYMNKNTFNLMQLMLKLSITSDDLPMKTAMQSHTSIGISYDAWYAIDRNTSTCMRTKPIGRNNPDKTVFWIVDLGEVFSIYSVHIMFKNYYGYGM